LPSDKPLTFASYECEFTTRAYIEPVAVGDTLPEMALFVEPNEAILVPLEATYQASYAVLPRRWRDVLDIAADGQARPNTIAGLPERIPID
jgi:hypothetical protein